jgi:hypothetical protein
MAYMQLEVVPVEHADVMVRVEVVLEAHLQRDMRLEENHVLHKESLP